MSLVPNITVGVLSQYLPAIYGLNIREYYTEGL